MICKYLEWMHIFKFNYNQFTSSYYPHVLRYCHIINEHKNLITINVMLILQNSHDLCYLLRRYSRQREGKY